MAIVNGRIPTVLLKYVGKNSVGKKLYVQRGKMARGLDLAIRMLALYIGSTIRLADAYRTLSEQRTARAYWTRLGQPWKAAWPGTSPHGLAKAVDFGWPLNTMSQAHKTAQWLFPLLGFSWVQGKAFGEPWHWVWVGFPDRPTLKLGSEGDEVKLWQLYLKLWQIATKHRIGGKLIKADGDFGPTTVALTKVWQKSKKMGQDGVVGGRSWEKARLV